MIRLCIRCDAEKPINEFYKHKPSNGGYRTVCKECLEPSYKDPEYKRNQAEREKRKRTDDPEYAARRNAENKAWRVANAKGLRAYRADPVVKSRQRETVRICIDRKRDHYNAVSLLKEHRRRARKRGLEGYHIYEELEEILTEQLGKCVYCRCSILHKFSVDHIIPISREGSTDFAYNLQLLCNSCNSSKKDKTHEEYIEYLKER
jgi:5-methylcytosine-specific restriction endonuclease McrA